MIITIINTKSPFFKSSLEGMLIDLRHEEGEGEGEKEEERKREREGDRDRETLM